MLKAIIYDFQGIAHFKEKALKWASSFETACYLDSNGYKDPYSAFEVFIAAGSQEAFDVVSNDIFDQLQDFLDKNQCYIPGFFSYDLKNKIEDLKSENADYLNFPDACFFIPQHLILLTDTEASIFSACSEEIISEIENTSLETENIDFSQEIKSRFSREEYCKTVHQIQDHIRIGDIYEMNLCQEFYAENVHLNPLAVFKKLNEVSPTPFSGFFKLNDKFIISATPERFLSKRGTKIISQPIKGTARRSDDDAENILIKEALRNDLKEQSENVMIVDLVRNDLSKCAIPGTVQVEELFGIYTFKQVHQMISTVVARVKPDKKSIAIIKALFPMGSMTGAPKIRAMELIEKYELTKRGVFSGSVGYFSPNGDFDFNVVIRTVLYNAETKYLSFQVGSAITIDADAEQEYNECLLKAEAILKALS